MSMSSYYQVAGTLIVDELAAETGALVLVDETTDAWGLVQSVEPDPLQDWRSASVGGM